MVDTQEFGYDKGRFPKLADESFDCIICSEVVRVPKECTGCGSLFCAPCINSWMSKKKECPNRCNAAESIKPIGKALLKMYNDLDVQCVHYEKCQTIVKFCDLEKHEKTCQLPKCENFELCNNFTQDKKRVCSTECELIFKLKAAKGDMKVMYKELKDYLTPYSMEKSPQVFNHHAKSLSGSIPTNQPMGNGPITWKWDSKFAAANIVFSKSDAHVYLKEASYIFKSVIGDTSFKGGVNYWEIHADNRTENELKIGVATKNTFDPASAYCDFDYGFAYYGLGQLRHGSNASGNPYGKKFKKEGVLGVCLDMNKGTLSFALDGEFMGVAFQAEALKKGPIWPAVALLHNAGCQVVTGKSVPQYFLR